MVTKNKGIGEPQQYSINDVSLITGTGTKISLKPSLIELSIFEELYMPSFSGYVIVTDSSGFVENFNINGFDFIKIAFSKSTPDDINQFDITFRVYKIEEVNQNTRTNVQYMIQFISEEMFLSNQKRIARSYTNMTIRDMIENILYEELRSTKLIDLDLTEGLYSMVVPNLTPFDAINWLATYAKPSKNDGGYVGADMFFYETRRGFHLRSLQSLYKQNIYAEYDFSPQNLYQPESAESMSKGLRSMITCKIVKHFDTLGASMGGLFANKFIGIDTLTKNKFITGFKYDDYIQGKLAAQGGKKPLTLNPYPLTAGFKNRFEKTVSEMTDASVKLVITNTTQRSNPLIKNSPQALQSVTPNIDAETRIPYRIAQFGLANYIKVEFSIAGDPMLRVGDIVKLNIPSLSVTKNKNAGNIDKYYSGKYMVSAIRHILDIDGSYKCVVLAVTDSLSAPNVPFIENEEINKAKG
jgi:hypothetical protein